MLFALKSMHCLYIWIICFCVFQLWDLEANKKMADCSGHLSWVQRVQFSPDGSQLLSCSDDQTVRVRIYSYGTSLQSLSGVTSVVFTF